MIRIGEARMLTFSCSACQKKLSVQDQHAGKKIKCPSCGAVATAPKSEPPPAPQPTIESVAESQATTAAVPPGVPTAKVQGHDPALSNFLAPPQAADELGRLGKYRVLGIIGHGGMGIVYRAEDSLLKRMVALKAILPSFGANEQIRKRFMREARALEQLNHDNVVRLFDVNEDRGIPYLAMEFLTGESLDARLRSGLVPLPEALRIGREIAEGLAAAHRQNLIHRDIKPANIFLAGKDRRVKILDFGLARADADDSRLTASGAILGTPSYMSPEQSRGDKVDFRCDLFSLGVVLYRLSTGREPFRGTDALSTMMAIASETPVAPQMQNLDVPSDLSDLIMTLLEKDSGKRGTAQAAVDALRQIEKGEPVPASVKPAAPPTETNGDAEPWQELTKNAPPPKAKESQFPWLIVVAALAAVLVCLSVPLAAVALYLFL